MANLGRRGNGAQESRDEVARHDAIPRVLEAARRAAFATSSDEGGGGALPRPWRESISEACDDAEEIYKSCRDDAPAASKAAAAAELRGFWGPALALRTALHAYGATKGRAELGAEKARRPRGFVAAGRGDAAANIESAEAGGRGAGGRGSSVEAGRGDDAARRGGVADRRRYAPQTRRRRRRGVSPLSRDSPANRRPAPTRRPR